MLTYSWVFPALDITYSADGFENVVNVVHWRYRAEDGA